MSRPQLIANKLINEIGLWALIKEDYHTHRRDWTRPGFRAMLVYRYGAWARGLRPFLLMAIFYRIYISLHRYIRNRYGIELYAKATIGRRFRIEHQGAIVIHEYATIGDDCCVRQGVTLGMGRSFDQETAPVLGDRVDVGAGAMIIGKVRIGNDVKIGPNAVVVVDVPEKTTVTAPPARFMMKPPPQAASPARPPERPEDQRPEGAPRSDQDAA